MREPLTTGRAVFLWILLVIVVVATGCTNPVEADNDNIDTSATVVAESYKWALYDTRGRIVIPPDELTKYEVSDFVAELDEFTGVYGYIVETPYLNERPR